MSTPTVAATTRVGESSGCQCEACCIGVTHDSDCAVHNAPAMPVGRCNCSVSFETRALSMLTDDQAMASFIRWRTALHGAKAVQSIRTAADVSEYVSAIFERIPG